MSLTKHSGFQVLSARIATEGGSLMRTAHRHEFKYEPRQGYLYVRSRAISSRCNDNFDEFPAAEIKAAYATFIGKPVFVNHHNDNHRRARGVIKDAVLHEDINPDGSPDTWCEVLMEVDAIRFPKLAKAILAGEIDRTSMGTDVAYSVCSVCNNKASSPVEYCSHIPKLKGQRIYRRTASGAQEGILVREICYGLGFFENSLLVEEPADPTAYFLGVDDHSGLTRAASRKTAEVEAVEVAGLAIMAEDTGRVLMIQRSFADEDDPARGTWEFPGGHLDDGEHPPTAAIREFAEEVGCEPPHGDIVGSWRSGPIYQGFLMTVPTEADINLHCSGTERFGNPDDPKGDDMESAAWWTIADAKANPALRSEVSSGTDWSVFEQQAKKTAAKQPLVLGHEMDWDTKPGPDGKYHSRCSCGNVGPARDNHTEAYVDALTHGGRGNPDYDEDEINAREFALHNPPPPPPKKPVQKWEPTEWVLASKTAATLNYSLTLECGDSARYVGTQPGQVSSGDAWTCKTHGETTVTQVSGSGATSNGLGWDSWEKRTALNEVPAPKEVDTLRDEACPVCGESDSYDGDKCQVCNFVAPPGEFMEPDLSKAKQTDLRQDQGDNNDKGGDLACDSCGANFSSTGAAPATPKTSVIMDQQKTAPDEQEAQSVDVAPKVGDPCPTCGEGSLIQAAPADPAAEQAQPDMGDPAAQFLPAGSASSDDAGDEDASDDADDQDGKDGDKPDFLKKKKKKPTAARSRGNDVEGAPAPRYVHGAVSTAAVGPHRPVRDTHEGEDVMRPALAALAAQQKQIEALKQGLAFVAEVAGISQHPRITSALKTAVDDNPAFGGGWDLGKPVEAAPEAPVATTQEAATPQAKDDVESQGSTPLTDVSADAETSLTDTGVVLPVKAPENQEVTAPVAGTDTLGKGEVGQAGTNRIETDVRAGTPSDNSAAFRDGGFLGAKDNSRVIAGLRLARLRIQAGIEQGDDLELGQAIAASQVSDETIQSEINTLAKVVTASNTTRPVARNLVPRSASGAQRTVPSMTATPGQGIEVVGSISDEEFSFE